MTESLSLSLSLQLCSCASPKNFSPFPSLPLLISKAASAYLLSSHHIEQVLNVDPQCVEVVEQHAHLPQVGFVRGDVLTHLLDVVPHDLYDDS